jgi:hypothetical protein
VPKNKRQTNAGIESFADLSTVIDGYDESIEVISGEWITAPAKAPPDRVWHLPSARFEPPSDLGKIACIIDEIVLRTNERAMHVNNPREASREWTWIINDEFEDDIDRALMRSFSWMSWCVEEDSGMNNSLGERSTIAITSFFGGAQQSHNYSVRASTMDTHKGGLQIILDSRICEIYPAPHTHTEHSRRCQGQTASMSLRTILLRDCGRR